MIRARSEDNPTMKSSPRTASETLLVPSRRRILYGKIQHFALRLSIKTSRSAAAAKSDTPPSPNTAPATKSAFELLYSEILCSELLYSELLYSELLDSELLYSELLYSELLYSELLYSELLDSELLYSELLYSELLDSELLYSELLYSELLDCCDFKTS